MLNCDWNIITFAVKVRISFMFCIHEYLMTKLPEKGLTDLDKNYDAIEISGREILRDY